MAATLSDFPFRFYVFSEDLGNQEGNEAEKILYSFPASRSLDDQLKDVGLSEAVLRFHDTFAGSGCYRVMRTSNGRITLYSPEKSIWICLVLKISALHSEAEGRQAGIAFGTDGILRNMLSMFYDVCHLYTGLIAKNLTEKSPATARVILKAFFDEFLRLAQPLKWSVTDLYPGICYLPLERVKYLETHTLVNRIACTFPEVETCLVLHKNHLVWSGLNQRDTQLLYFYTTRLLLNDNSSPKADSKTLNSGQFVSGLLNLEQCHLWSFPDRTDLSLLFYQALGSCIVLVVSGELAPLQKELSDFFSEYLVSVSAELLKGSKSQSSTAVAHSGKDDLCSHFIYYNHCNSALKSSMQWSESSRLRTLLLSDYLQPLEPVEVALSISLDSWLVLKKASQRSLILVVQRQRGGTCTLSHVAEEMRRLSQGQFQDILFLEM